MPWTPATTVELFDRATFRAPAADALLYEDRRWSWAEYAAAVDGFARALAVLGAPGRPVAIVLRNSPQLAVGIWAAQRAGGIAATLNPDYTAAELAPMLADAAPAAVVTYPDLAARIRDAGWDGPTILADTLDDLPGGEARLPAVSPDDLAVLMFTGGTTGRPKGVLLTHRAVATNVAQREARLPTVPGDERVLAVMPLFHSFAQAMCLHLAAYAGGALVILPRYRPDWLLDAVARHRVTRLPAGPTVFHSLLAYDGLAAADLSSLRCCYSGSAALPAATLGAWRAATGTEIHEGYGQTEAGPVLTYNGPGVPARPGAVGTPLPLTDIRLADAAGGDAPEGEIIARGPQLMSGYLNRPDETAAALRGGWLRTGDVGRWEDGQLVITGRLKELVIVGGYNGYPREVEEVLAAVPGVREAAVVGVPDPYRGEALWAFLTGAAAPETVAAHCEARLAKYKRPAQWRVLAALPRTAVGKVDRAALVTLAEAERAAA